jgi:hypothetical protein
VALSTATIVAHEGWWYEQNPQRGDGNGGHCSIDFGNQYLLARMIVTGHAHELYHRSVHKQVLEEVYPTADGTAEGPTDVQALLDWMLHRSTPDNPDLAGPLYPPVHAILYAPLGLLSPRPAYRVLQGILLVLVFYCGWAVQRISSGRIWWPVASALLLVWPGFNGVICLAQNAVITLALLLTGWMLLQQGRPFSGGIAWGFLAFKPVWVPAFGLALLLTRRWRFLAGMVLTGLVLSAVTLPLVGWHSWRDWLAMGQLAAEEYSWQENWVILSRDLSGLYRHDLLTFKDGYAASPALTNPSQLLATGLGWALWLDVVGATVVVALWRRQQVRALLGPGAAFVLLGGYFACYHFMYYDIVVGAFPVALLFAEPRRFLQPSFRPRRLAQVSPELLAYYQPSWDQPSPPAVPLLPGGMQLRWACNPLPPLLLVLLPIATAMCITIRPDYKFPPVDTFLLVAIWAWCCVWVIRGGDQEAVGKDH